ncbi:spermidine synthase [Paenibacillus pectinilyticus]|uniref:Spermidine synthase n=1 Tax=Paenibacillus pectinilyticus TaxID=512399 RepID=A0A1C1A221_9BACL|nr:fused MFS/spermidine synthase [Paenibacillus pectinilyticus]OCT14584.1 spermidine synthase [Paenibacillus pectinilyticus]
MDVLFKELTAHHDITIYDTDTFAGEKGRFRILEFSNHAMQGAMDLRQPDRVLFEYPRAMIHLMQANNHSFQRVFLIGHGIGSIASHLKEKRFTVAELDEHVVALSRRYFGYSQDNVRIGDGRQLLREESASTYDYILVDAFTEKGTPLSLTSLSFFQMAAQKLDAEGAILLNLMGKGEQDPLLAAIHTTLHEVFPYVKAYKLPSEGRRDPQNIILMGQNKPITANLRQMAGFVEMMPGYGHILMDNE